ncbi:MAG: hypothetical protein LUQ01_01075 [Methanolinea sp.]|nr:hypothetical protein [Methanolinea sp.]
MKAKGILFVCILMATFLLVAGCTQTPGTPATPTPTVPVTVPATPPQTQAPTQAPTLGYIDGPIPTNYDVSVQVDRNTIVTPPIITATFRGGKGINFVSSIQVVVTRSDGQVIEKTMQKPQVNDKVEIEGTRGKDRVSVFVNLVDGNRYKIYDQEFETRAG